MSTLPDNPGDFGFWTVSPGLQIRVWNLVDNSRRLDKTRLWHKIWNILHHLTYFTVNMDRRIRTIPHCNINWSRQVVLHKWGHVRLWHHSSFPYEFSMFEDSGGGWQPCHCISRWCLVLLETLCLSPWNCTCGPCIMEGSIILRCLVIQRVRNKNKNEYHYASKNSLTRTTWTIWALAVVQNGKLMRHHTKKCKCFAYSGSTLSCSSTVLKQITQNYRTHQD